MYVLLHLAALTVTVLALSRLFPAVRVKSVGTAIVVAIVFSVLNFFLDGLIKLLLVVPALLTLGLLFFFVPLIVNTVLLWLTDKLIRSFEIQTMGALLGSAAVITLVNWLFHAALHAHRASVFYRPGPPRWI
jgi:putative membrane protein